MRSTFLLIGVMGILPMSSLAQALCELDIGPNLQVCGWDSIHVGDNIQINGIPPFTYDWGGTSYSFPMGFTDHSAEYLSDSTVSNPYANAYSGTLTLQLTVTDSIGAQCIDSMQVEFSLPIITSLDQYDVYIELGDSVILNPSGIEYLITAYPPFEYYWSDTYGTIQDTGITTTVFPTESGVQYLGFSDGNGCVFPPTEDLYHIYVDGVNDIFERETESLSVFPNPSMGTFEIQLPSKLGGINFMIHDSNGRLIRHGILGSNKLDLSGEKPGTYFLRIGTETLELLKH